VAEAGLLHGVYGQEPDGVYQPLHQLCHRRGRPTTVVDRPPRLQLRPDERRARRKPRPGAAMEAGEVGM
jgi:hypothetical protein